jgi:hypothetical protein
MPGMELLTGDDQDDRSARGTDDLT